MKRGIEVNDSRGRRIIRMLVELQPNTGRVAAQQNEVDPFSLLMRSPDRKRTSRLDVANRTRCEQSAHRICLGRQFNERNNLPSSFVRSRNRPTGDRTGLLCYFFCSIVESFRPARLFHPWKREKSPASHASRSPGALRSQSGRISLVTARRSCQRSMTDGRPQNQ